MTSSNRLNWDYAPKSDGVIDIPVRVKPTDTEPVPQSAPRFDTDEAIVREYEERYFGNTQQPPNANYTTSAPSYKKRKNGRSRMWERMQSVDIPPSQRYKDRKAPQMTGQNDHLWAAVAHGSAIATLLAIGSGPGLIFGLLIPLGMYLLFRNRSDYVAFHALQAFTFQTMCTVGVLVVSATLGVATFASFLASFLLVGIPFLFFFGLLFAMSLVFGVFTVFVVMPVYSMIGAFNAFNGGSFRYPWVADWVDDQLMNGKPRPTVV